MQSKRVINFCHPSLQSSISCSTCSSDDYEETNLLSSDTAKFRRGFMADRFIKPPVDIAITFKHPVNLSHIKIWPRVGQQKSCGLEISTTFTERSSFSGGSRDGKPKEIKFSAGRAGDTACERISFCSLSDSEDGVVFYCPRKFKKYDIGLFIQDATNFAKKSFKWCKQSAITDVKIVTIKITRTQGSSVPALGKIEIWGEPGIRNTRPEKREQWHMWEQRCEERNQHTNPASAADPRSPKAGTSKESLSTALDLKVPEEFLDALTCEIMSLPMVLPSGKVVDQLTLERHQNSEANWGRPPNDPFTGMPFTPSLHPVLDNALKSRIDHFLVVHQDREDLRLVPRTLGRTGKSSGTGNTPSFSNEYRGSASSICSENNNRKKLDKKTKLTPSLNSSHVSHLCADVASSSSSSFEQRSSGNTQSNATSHSKKRSPSPELQILSENIASNKIAKMSNGLEGSYTLHSKTHSESNLSRSSPETQRDNIDDGLDDALKAVLTGLPSFIDANKCPATQPMRKCGKCDKAENLFMLPCDHLICRTCLLQSTKLKQPQCWNCNSLFTSSQPVRYHH